MTASYRINIYDQDGDVSDSCILIHIQNDDFIETGTILRFNGVEELDSFIKSLKNCREECHREIQN